MKELVTERFKLKDVHPGWAKDLAKENEIDVDDLELVRKGVVAEKAETDDEGVVSFINMEGQDRDNEEIDPEGAVLSYYRKNPVVPYGHDYRGLPVGKNIWVKKATKGKKRGLLAKTVFLNHDFAQEVGKLYTEDVAGTGPALKGWSIGFIPLRWEEPEEKGKPPKDGEADTRPRRKYTKWELVEYSAVMIPSNRDALTEMVEKGAIKSDKLIKDIESLIEKDLVTKPEETEDFIRIPVRDCKVTATIDISKKQGIKALYCGKIKKVRTYIFDKREPYNWTMAKAKKWVEEHGKEIDQSIENHKWVQEHLEREVTDMEKGVIPYRDTGKAPEEEKWDGPKEVREAEVSDLKIMCTWFDSENPDIKSSYKLPHHKASGHAAVWRGVAAAMAALLGARGGTNIPGGDRKGVYNHLKKHYGQFDKEPPEFREYTEEELKQIFPEVYEQPETDREQKITRELFDGLVGQLNGLEEEFKTIKEGRVLSEKNRKLIKNCITQMGEAITALNALMQATEPPQREEINLDMIRGSDSGDGGQDSKTGDKNKDKDFEFRPEDIETMIQEIIKGIASEMTRGQIELKKEIEKARGKVE
jgi:hypothetical protein